MTKENLNIDELNLSFADEVANTEDGKDIRKCFACGTCTISCPVFEVKSEYNPRKIIRMVLLGMREELLSSELIWMCAGCYTCYERCPQDVKFTTIIHSLRNLAMQEAQKGKIKLKWPGFYFAKEFVGSVKLYGRLWEAGLVTKLLLDFKDIGKAFGYAPLGLKMLQRNKLSFFPKGVKNKKEIKQIFDKVKKLELN